MPLLGTESRVINLLSTAQAPVDLRAMRGEVKLNHMEAYSQSKLALTMLSRQMALALPEGPVIEAVNPASMLGSRMVKEAFGVAGGDLSDGARILVLAALSDEFANATGKYYDNDQRRFAPSHSDVLKDAKCE